MLQIKKRTRRTIFLGLMLSLTIPHPQIQAIPWWKVTLAAAAAVMAGTYWWLNPPIDDVIAKVDTLGVRANNLNMVINDESNMVTRLMGTKLLSNERIAEKARQTSGSVVLCRQNCLDTISSLENARQTAGLCLIRFQHRQAFDRKIYAVGRLFGMEQGFLTDLSYSSFGQKVISDGAQCYSEVVQEKINNNITSLEKTVTKLNEVIKGQQHIPVQAV